MFWVVNTKFDTLDNRTTWVGAVTPPAPPAIGGEIAS